jgi:hypothetical protein
MANSFLDLREVRPEPLRCEVHFGLALAVWLRVNEKPPLVPLERQSLSCVGIQRQPPLPSFGQPARLLPPKFPRITAKLRSHTTIIPFDVRAN